MAIIVAEHFLSINLYTQALTGLKLGIKCASEPHRLDCAAHKIKGLRAANQRFLIFRQISKVAISTIYLGNIQWHTAAKMTDNSTTKFKNFSNKETNQSVKSNCSSFDKTGNGNDTISNILKDQITK